MRRTYRINQVINWSIAIFLAWLFGRGILWSILEYLIRYDITNYDAKRALYGMISLVVLSVSLSTVRDIRNKSETRLVVDNINANLQTKYLELIVFGSRIALTGYIFTYWVNQGSYLMMQKDTIVVPDLFMVLLVLGAGVALITVISGYIIILEPWRIFMVGNNDKFEHQSEISLSIGRCLSFFIINLLLWWFYVPRLETKLPSVLTFIICLIIMIKFQVSYYKARKTATSD